MTIWWHKKPSTKPDLPPAVVPKPVPPPVAQKPVTMVTSVFCGWASPRPEFGAVPGSQCPNEWPWKAMQTEDRIPAMGEYDERDPAVTAWRLQKMKEGGIDVACYQVDWSHEHAVKAPDYLPPLPTPLLMAHCADNHPTDSPVKFCLSFWDVMTGPEGVEYFTALKRDRGWTDADLEESFGKFANAVTSYMVQPNYWHIDGRPVLYRGWAHTLAFYKEQFGFNVAPERIIAIWREEIKAVVGVEPYLVATSMDPAYRQNLKAWGFNCLTEYLLHGDGWDTAMAVYRGWWATDLAECRQQGIEYIVPVTAGYDSRAWGSLGPPVHIPTAIQFEAHVREARKLARDNADICRGVGSYSWSEWGEQESVIEPHMPEYGGDTMLRAHASACR